MDRLQTITLALLQGITEFLPISSAAHLILASELTGWPDQGLAFDIAVHLGSLAAVVAYYRRDCAAFAVSAWGGLRHGHRDAQLDLLLKIAVATLPVALCGLALRDMVANELRDGWVIATATVTFAFALWWANGQRGERQLLGWGDALLIGMAQAIAHRSRRVPLGHHHQCRPAARSVASHRRAVRLPACHTRDHRCCPNGLDGTSR